MRFDVMVKAVGFAYLGWVAGAILGALAAATIYRWSGRETMLETLVVMVGGGTSAVIMAMASLGADVVVAIKQIKPFVLEAPAEPPQAIDAIRAGKPQS